MQGFASTSRAVCSSIASDQQIRYRHIVKVGFPFGFSAQAVNLHRQKMSAQAGKGSKARVASLRGGRRLFSEAGLDGGRHALARWGHGERECFQCRGSGRDSHDLQEVAASNRRTVGLHEMVDGVEGSHEMLPRRAGGGWDQRGQARPLSMGEDIRSYVWRGESKSPRWRGNGPILSDPLSGWIGYVQAPFGRRGSNGERAAGAPCQDERLAKTGAVGAGFCNTNAHLAERANAENRL